MFLERGPWWIPHGRNGNFQRAGSDWAKDGKQQQNLKEELWLSHPLYFHGPSAPRGSRWLYLPRLMVPSTSPGPSIRAQTRDARERATEDMIAAGQGAMNFTGFTQANRATRSVFHLFFFRCCNWGGGDGGGFRVGGRGGRGVRGEGTGSKFGLATLNVLKGVAFLGSEPPIVWGLS